MTNDAPAAIEAAPHVTLEELGMSDFYEAGLRRWSGVYDRALQYAGTAMHQAMVAGSNPATHEWKPGGSPDDALARILYDVFAWVEEVVPLLAEVPELSETVRTRPATRREHMTDILHDLLISTDHARRCGQIDGRSMGEHGVHSWNHAALMRAVDRLEALP